MFRSSNTGTATDRITYTASVQTDFALQQPAGRLGPKMLAERMVVPMPRKSSKTSSAAPLEHAKSSVFTQYVGTLEVKPRQQSRMSLGLYSDSRPAKGFSIDYLPEPIDTDAISALITSLGRASHYELTLQITNFSDQKVAAEVWSM